MCFLMFLIIQNRLYVLKFNVYSRLDKENSNEMFPYD